MKKFLFLIILIYLSPFLKAQDFNPVQSNVDSFLEIATTKKKSKFDLITVVSKFPPNWITEKDIDKLIKILDSKVTCKCTISRLSSFLPSDNAELGGYAVIFIESFKNNILIDLGLYSCPETNSKKTKEIIDWWKKYRKK